MRHLAIDVYLIVIACCALAVLVAALYAISMLGAQR